MDELQEYFSSILAHLDAMAKRTIFMMGVEYGKQKSREQESNFSGGFSTEEKTETMLINLSGVSINSKPRADGRYQGYAMRDGEKKYFYGKTPEEVRDKIQKYLKSAPAPKRKKRTEKAAPTLEEYAIKWAETYKRPNMKPTSFQCLEYALKKPIASLGEKPLNLISSDDLQNFFNALPQSRARDLCKTYLSQLFEKAVATKVIRENPFTAVEIKKQTRQRKTGLTPDQTKIFLQFVEGRSLSLLFRFLLATGLRIGEALALTPNDIDDEERAVKVNKNIVFLENGEVLTQRPKTQAAVRTVPLTDSLYTELCIIKTDRIFPYTYNYVRKFISGISKRVGFPVTVHTLRHTYADRLEEAGIPPKIKQYLLGHADLDTTQNVYTDTQAHYIQAFLPQIRWIFDTK